MKLTPQERKEVLEVAGIKDENVKIKKYEVKLGLDNFESVDRGGLSDNAYYVRLCYKEDLENKKLFALRLMELEDELLKGNGVEKIISRISFMMEDDDMIKKREVVFTLKPSFFDIHDGFMCPMHFMSHCHPRGRKFCFEDRDFQSGFDTNEEIEEDLQVKITVVKPHPHDDVIYTIGDTFEEAIKTILKKLKNYFKFKYMISYKKYKEQLLEEENKELREKNEKLMEEIEKLKRQLNASSKCITVNELKERIKEARFNGLFGDKGRITSYKELKNAFIKALDQI